MSGATRDAALTIGLVIAFAAFVSLHLATVFGIARKRQIGAAVAGLFVPPLAPYWAFTHGMRVRAVVWVASAALYGAALVMNR